MQTHSLIFFSFFGALVRTICAPIAVVRDSERVHYSNADIILGSANGVWEVVAPGHIKRLVKLIESMTASQLDD